MGGGASVGASPSVIAIAVRVALTLSSTCVAFRVDAGSAVGLAQAASSRLSKSAGVRT